jgi:hypothetical protein
LLIRSVEAPISSRGRLVDHKKKASFGVTVTPTGIVSEFNKDGHEHCCVLC